MTILDVTLPLQELNERDIFRKQILGKARKPVVPCISLLSCCRFTHFDSTNLNVLEFVSRSLQCSGMEGLSIGLIAKLVQMNSSDIHRTQRFASLGDGRKIWNGGAIKR